jgi:hypothetical protein
MPLSDSISINRDAQPSSLLDGQSATCAVTAFGPILVGIEDECGRERSRWCNGLPISVAIFAVQLLLLLGGEILEGSVSKSVNMAVSTFPTLPSHVHDVFTLLQTTRN